MLQDPAKLFASLAHPTRLRCLLLLLRHDSLCVCELVEALRDPQPHVSRHLASLREVGLVTDHRRGLWVHYAISRDLPIWADSLLTNLVADIGDQEPFCNDFARLIRLPVQADGARCG